MSAMEAAMHSKLFLYALVFERCLKQRISLRHVGLIVELLGQTTSNLVSDM